MGVYKSEDSKIIYEYLNELKEKTQKDVVFINALTRELKRGQIAQEELNKTKPKIDESWDSIEK